MKFRVNYANTWEGCIEVEAESKEKAFDLACRALSEDLEENELNKVLYGPKEFPGDYEITGMEELKK